MEIDTKITNVSIESMKNQNGNAISKIWEKPFGFYLIGTFVDNPEYKNSFNYKYKFTCNIVNEKTNTPNVEYINVSKWSKNRQYVLPGNSDNRVIFNIRITEPGKYIASISSSINTKFVEFVVV